MVFKLAAWGGRSILRSPRSTVSGRRLKRLKKRSQPRRNQRQRHDVGVSDTEVWSKMAVMIVNHCILVYPVPSDSIPDFPTNRDKAVFVAHSVFLFIWIWCSISNLDPYANCVDCLQGLLNKPKSRETSCDLSFSGAWEGWDSWASQGGTQTWGEGKEPVKPGG